MAKHKRRSNDRDGEQESDFSHEIESQIGAESLISGGEEEIELESASTDDFEEAEEGGSPGDESREIDISKVMPEFRDGFLEMQEAMGQDRDEGDIFLEQKVGVDDRQRVPDTTKAPFRAICFLRSTFGPGHVEVGTGWLVAPQLIITAGHVVYNRDIRRRAQQIEIHPGLNRTSQFVAPQTVNSSRLRTTRQYLDPRTPNRRHPDVDYGAILLRSPFPRVGFFGFSGNYSNSMLSGQVLNVVGYPAERMRTMWGHARKVSDLTPQRLIYQIDTTPGQSGSPVYDFVPGNGNAPDRFIVVGIHNASSSIRTDQNFAARITPSAASLFATWKRESER